MRVIYRCRLCRSLLPPPACAICLFTNLYPQCIKQGGFICQADKFCLPGAACNGVKDCSDGADERQDFCTAYNCSLNGDGNVSDRSVFCYCTW